MHIFKEKTVEVSKSILPIVILVILLNLFIVPIGTNNLIQFLIGSVLMIIGMIIFLVGTDFSISKIGKIIGKKLSSKNNLLILVMGLILGFIISIAEPDLHIIAKQVQNVTDSQINLFMLVTIVSIGISIMLSFGLYRILKSFKLNDTFTFIYLIILILSFFTSNEFLAISFDSSGATTGALTVPFILALGIGVSLTKKSKKDENNCPFGLVGITSTGAIISVLIVSILKNIAGIHGEVNLDTNSSTPMFLSFLNILKTIGIETFVALCPISIFYLLLNKLRFKDGEKITSPILKGLLLTYFGLVLFLTGVNFGFIKVGIQLGYSLADYKSYNLLLIISFLIGFLTIFVEPAVNVLTHQIEDITEGEIKRKTVMISLSIGVAFAVLLSIVRIIIPSISLWHFLLPGYLISIILSYIVDDIFVGIAFDSGGVASGPMTATFILAFAQGVAQRVDHASVLIDGFGIIAQVALTPILAILILGLSYKYKKKKIKKVI